MEKCVAVIPVSLSFVLGSIAVLLKEEPLAPSFIRHQGGARAVSVALCTRERALPDKLPPNLNLSLSYRREDAFRRREDALRKKDLELQESLIKFNKFLQVRISG